MRQTLNLHFPKRSCFPNTLPYSAIPADSYRDQGVSAAISNTGVTEFETGAFLMWASAIRERFLKRRGHERVAS